VFMGQLGKAGGERAFDGARREVDVSHHVFTTGRRGDDAQLPTSLRNARSDFRLVLQLIARPPAISTGGY